MLALTADLLIFSFQFSLLFFHIGRLEAQQRMWFTQYQTLNVAANLGRYFFVGSVHPREMSLN